MLILGLLFPSDLPHSLTCRPSCLQIGADGSPILNARQRRTLRRAQERAMKGLEEAGRVLLMQHGCLRGPSGGGAEGADAEGAESGAGKRNERVDEGAWQPRGAGQVGRR